MRRASSERWVRFSPLHVERVPQNKRGRCGASTERGHGRRKPVFGTALAWSSPQMHLTENLGDHERQQRVQRSGVPSQMNILVIDDEPEICLLLRAILAGQGSTSASANSLAEAREILLKESFNVVFVDVNLPDGKGYELIPEIKRLGPDVRVIVISAMDQERKGSMDAGADAFLSKPLYRHTILQSLKDLGISS
jgi:two-component system, OmpR family, response regulator